MRLVNTFFDQGAVSLAKSLIGKVICRQYQGVLLKAQIIETEAYGVNDKASHASLGYTEKRKALFMPPGTIYMYYSRGSDSMNISAKGEGAAVLIKSAIIPESQMNSNVLNVMLNLNRLPKERKRNPKKLLSGQTLLCKSLAIKVKDWDQKQFNDHLYISDNGYQPKRLISAPRLGIPEERDSDFMYRFIDHAYPERSTKNPLTTRKSNCYSILEL